MIDMKAAVSRTFGRAGVRARAVGDVVESLAVRTVHVDADPLDVVAAARMRRALCTALESRHVIVQDADDGGLLVMVPQDDHRGLTIPQLWRVAPPVGLSVPIGLDIEMQPLWWDISKVPHGGANGITGSGKTWLVRTIIAGLAVGNPPGELRIVPIDPKGSTWIDPLCRLAHLDHAPCTNAPDGNAALERVGAEIRARIAGTSPRVPMVVIVDEADMLDPVLLRFIVDYGRELQVFAFLTSRRLGKTALPIEVYGQLGARFCGAVAAGDHYTSKMALGNARLATHLFGRGDMYACIDDVLTRFQAAGCHPDTTFWRASGWAGRCVDAGELPRVTAGEGGAGERQPRAVHPSQAPKQLPADVLAWIASETRDGQLPAINRIQARFSVGGGCATRWQADARAAIEREHSAHSAAVGMSITTPAHV